MPPMTLLGWFHTIFGIAAVLLAASALYRQGAISASDRIGKLYLIVTVVVAGSALGIYNQGGFGIAHILAVLTLGAVATGLIFEYGKIFGGLSAYCQAICYSATVLFHMIPAITDFLRRLPVGDPFIGSFDSPLLQGFHLAFLAIYVLGVVFQCYRLKQARAAA